MEEKLGVWVGTIKDMKEWLNQFNDDDEILFAGGEDDGGEFMQVQVNNEEVILVG